MPRIPAPEFHPVEIEQQGGNLFGDQIVPGIALELLAGPRLVILNRFPEHHHQLGVRKWCKKFNLVEIVRIVNVVEDQGLVGLRSEHLVEGPVDDLDEIFPDRSFRARSSFGAPRRKIARGREPGSRRPLPTTVIPSVTPLSELSSTEVAGNRLTRIGIEHTSKTSANRSGSRSHPSAVRFPHTNIEIPHEVNAGQG